MTEPVPTWRDEIARLMACRCGPEWTERRLHAPDCVQELGEDVTEIADAELSRLTSALSTAERQRDSLARRCAVRYEETEAQRTRAEWAEAELERTREVVRAAKAWRKSMQPVIANGQLPGTRPQTRALVVAVDALRTDKEAGDGE